MGQDSKIEWCDHTFNPWVGCQKVSVGCRFCYAERNMTRKPRWANAWGPPETSERVRTKTWGQPLRWNKQAELEDRRHKVFCASLADIFEDNPQVVEWRRELWHLIESTPFLDWLLLTKRPENIDHMLPPNWMLEQFPRNVWLGFSASNQSTFDARMPILESFAYLFYPVVIFVSLEPLLGPVDLQPWLIEEEEIYERGRHSLDRSLDWVICGGESGPGARPMHPEWPGNLRDQCVEAGVPFHFKQWGEWALYDVEQHEDYLRRLTRRSDFERKRSEFIRFLHESGSDDPTYKETATMLRVGKKAAGRLLNGLTWDQMPLSGLSCSECGDSGYLEDGQGGGEFCGCNAQSGRA